MRQIAIDELYLGRTRKYITLVMDMESARIIWVGEGRGAEALREFWRRFKLSGARLKAVAMDMSGAYACSVRAHAPHAILTFDRFHVMKLMNERLDDLRRELGFVRFQALPFANVGEGWIAFLYQLLRVIWKVGWVGLEPTTNALKGRCSTIELPTRKAISLPPKKENSKPASPALRFFGPQVAELECSQVSNSQIAARSRVVPVHRGLPRLAVNSKRA